MPAADPASPLTPDDIAARTFSTHFRGYDTGEVKAFLRSMADSQRALLARVERAEATEAKAAELLSAAETRAAELLREAQDEARRIVDAVAGEREKAFTEGASRADALVAEAESERQRIEEDARREAARLVAEGKAARTRVLDDLRRRRKVARGQVEQLHAARERLLAHLNDVRNAIDSTSRQLRDAMPEVKAAADAAARRVAVEEDASIEQLESEIDALKLAGLSLLPVEDEAAAPVAPAVPEPASEGAPTSAAAESADDGTTASSSVDGPAEAGGDTTAAEGSSDAEAAGQEEGVSDQAASDQPATDQADSDQADSDQADSNEVTDEDDGDGRSIDRRSSSVRLVRPRRSKDQNTGLPDGELIPLDPPDPSEAVRIVGAGELHDIDLEELAPITPAATADVDDGAPTEPAVEADTTEQAASEPAEESGVEPETDEGDDGAADDAAAADAAEPDAAESDADGRPSQEAVGALFARLKAGRDEPAAAPAPEVVPGPAGSPAAPDLQPAGHAAADAAADAAEVDGAVGVDGTSVEVPPERAALLARRDATLAPATKALNRHLKRLLADEQNDLLDRLRRKGTKAALLDAAEHDAAWAEASSSELALAAAAGGSFFAAGGMAPAPSPDDLVAVAEALADAVARPLRDRLSTVLADADGDADVAGDGIRAAYRTWRSERLGPAIDHAVHDAFGLGVLVAFGSSQSVCWLVDDGGAPCPDCDDDALAGGIPAGEAFPTGHRRPPAHPGCRCLLVPADHPALASS